MAPQEGFTVKELYDVIQKQTQTINWYWNFYVGSIIFIIGFINASDNYDKLDTFQLIFLNVSFISFQVVSFLSLLGATTTLTYFVDEFSEQADKLPDSCYANIETKKRFKSFSKPNKYLLCFTIVGQLIGLLIVLIAINFPYLPPIQI